jgi:hypothetical protein
LTDIRKKIGFLRRRYLEAGLRAGTSVPALKTAPYWNNIYVAPQQNKPTIQAVKA